MVSFVIKLFSFLIFYFNHAKARKIPVVLSFLNFLMRAPVIPKITNNVEVVQSTIYKVHTACAKKCYKITRLLHTTSTMIPLKDLE